MGRPAKASKTCGFFCEATPTGECEKNKLTEQRQTTKHVEVDSKGAQISPDR